MRRAVFLDRDGVINAPVVRDGKPYPPQTLEEFQILPGVETACAQLKSAGFFLVVATNQPDVGRGTQLLEVVEAMHDLLRTKLPLDGVEVCYHSGKEPCACRKPAPGMLFTAADRLGLDLGNSFMVGDRWRDIDCGSAAGCRTVFIDRGYSEELRIRPHFQTEDLPKAADWILGQSLL